MEENEKTFEAYFSGKMHSAQANDFHAALEANPEFKRNYEEFLAIKKAASNIERDNFRQLLNKVEIEDSIEEEDGLLSSSASIIPLLKRVVGIAAIFVVGFFGYQLLSSTSTDQLYAQNFETYDAQSSRGHNTDALKAQYLNGNYTEFIISAMDVAETPEMNMMLANAYINEAEWEKAINHLTQIGDESSLRDQKYWYLGLVNLKTGNSKQAIQHLDYLRSISNYKKSELEEILSTIRK